MGRVKTSYDNVRTIEIKKERKKESQAGNWSEIQEADAIKQIELFLQLFTSAMKQKI